MVDLTAGRVRDQARGAVWAVALALFLFALLPRALAGSFLTVDEAYHWLGRVQRFLDALAAGDWAGTNLIGHPGVTTLWLGAAGELLYRAMSGWGLVAPGPSAQLALNRLPLAAVNALCVALAYPLLRRLLGGRVALLAALVWAAEPFLVAHGQLLHLDALLASFMTLSILAALVGMAGGSGQREETAPHRSARCPLPASLRWWALSGLFGGLALLTKSPAVLLAPMVGLISVAGVRWQGADGGVLRSAFRLLPSASARVGVWVGVAALVWLALWPAAWVDPSGAVGRVFLQASADGGAPHGWGNFFLGRAVEDPGPLFYPVTTALRLAPWTLVGLLALLGWTLHDWRSAGGRVGTMPSPHPGSGLVLLMLAVFAAGFLAAMTAPPKKFDRYALPAYPALTILAAAGLSRIYDLRFTIYDWARGRLWRLRVPDVVGWGAVVVVLAGNLALHQPYHLAYFNPLLGGGREAARLVPVGWGEGYEQAGAYIASQPNGADRPVAARYEPVLGPFVPYAAVPLAWAQTPGRVDYAVVYIDQVQRNEKPETFRPLLERLAPVHIVRINGIEYAYVYQIPPPVARPLVADFGGGMRLRGYGLDAAEVRATGALTLTLEWESRARAERDYTLFAHIFNTRGERVGQVDVPPGGDRAPTSRWEPGHFVSLVQRIPLPADLPAGEYRVAIGLYDPRTFARVPLVAPPRPSLPEAGPDALVLDPFEIP